jgi:hypothetical protein
VVAAGTQAGFIALNRFGLGSRRDGDLAAASSDPPGFLKAELAEARIALLEAPALPRTALALKILYSDLEQKRLERLAAEMVTPIKVAEAAPAMDAPSMQGSEARIQAEPWGGLTGLPHRGIGAVAAGADRSAGLCRAPRRLLDKSFLRLDDEGRLRAHLCGRVRARRHPATCARAIPRHAAGCREPSGNAVLSR